MNISIFNYGDYSSDNYGSSRAVTIGCLTLYFSYKTVIAVQDGPEMIISENAWRTTTGRHLNCIDRDKSIRLSRDVFCAKLAKVLKRHKLEV